MEPGEGEGSIPKEIAHEEDIEIIGTENLGRRLSLIRDMALRSPGRVFSSIYNWGIMTTDYDASVTNNAENMAIASLIRLTENTSVKMQKIYDRDLQNAIAIDTGILSSKDQETIVIEDSLYPDNEIDATVLVDICGGFIDDIEHNKPSLAYQELPGQTYVVVLGEKDRVNDLMRQTSQTVEKAGEILTEVVGPKPDKSQYVVVLDTDGSKIVMPHNRGMHLKDGFKDSSITITLNVPSELPSARKRAELEIQKTTAHERAHYWLGDFPSRFLAEGFAQTVDMLVTNKPGTHSAASDDTVSLDRVDKYIRAELNGNESTNSRDLELFTYDQLYSHSRSLFATIYSFGEEGREKQQFGQFIAKVRESADIKMSFEQLYNESAENLDRKWKETVAAFKTQTPASNTSFEWDSMELRPTPLSFEEKGLSDIAFTQENQPRYAIEEDEEQIKRFDINTLEASLETIPTQYQERVEQIVTDALYCAVEERDESIDTEQRNWQFNEAIQGLFIGDFDWWFDHDVKDEASKVVTTVFEKAKESLDDTSDEGVVLYFGHDAPQDKSQPISKEVEALLVGVLTESEDKPVKDENGTAVYETNFKNIYKVVKGGKKFLAVGKPNDVLALAA